MPPRKSDQLRKGETSVARLITMDDDTAEAANSIAAAAPSIAPPQAQAAGSTQASSDKKEREKDPLAIEDLNLPKSIITRLAKGVLPPNTQIQANAILALSKSATVFINYLADAAHEHTLDDNKKTITPADVFKALDDTEFSFLRAPLEAEVAKFNEIQSTKRSAYRKKLQAAKKAAISSSLPDSSLVSAPVGEDTTLGDAGVTISAAVDSTAPKAKKAKIDPAEEDRDEDDPQDDDEIEPDDEAPEEDDEVEEAEEEDDDEDDGDEDEGSETQDADAMERRVDMDKDEALDDGDESD